MRKRKRKRRISTRRRERYWHTLRQELMRRRDEGAISREDFDTAFDTMSNPKKADRVIARASQEVGSVDWVSLVDWIKDHWLEILKIVISVAFLFLEGDDESSGPDREVIQ